MIDHTPCSTIAAVGVRYSGCSRASRGKKTPSAAIAWKTRGVTRITRFRKPNVEAVIPAEMIVAPTGPSRPRITSAAGALLCANPAGLAHRSEEHTSELQPHYFI